MYALLELIQSTNIKGGSLAQLSYICQFTSESHTTRFFILLLLSQMQSHKNGGCKKNGSILLFPF